MADNTELTLRDLIELAHNGNAADFTSFVRIGLDSLAEDRVLDLMVEDPEEDEDLDFDFDTEDDIPDVDEEDDLDEELLDERNKLNHQKVRAFRAGAKETMAKNKHVTSRSYMSNRDKWSGEGDRRIAAQKAAKAAAHEKSQAMYHDAAAKGIALGGKSRQFSRLRDAGKKLGDKARAGNDSYKNSPGRYLDRHLSNQHMKIKNEVGNLHRSIINHIYKHDGSDESKYGSSFRFGGKGAEPEHIQRLKDLHGKLSQIHNIVKRHLPEELNLDIIKDDVDSIAEEFLMITEGHSFSNKNWDDDTIRVKGKDKKISHRQERRKWKLSLEDIEPGSLSLADDLTDDELQDLADNITEEHFDLLDDESQELLIPFLVADETDETLDELSNSVLNSYVRRASHSLASNSYHKGAEDNKIFRNSSEIKNRDRTVRNRISGIKTAANKLSVSRTEEERYD